MRFLCIFGAQGQIGSALRALAKRTGIPHRAFTRADCDITNASALAEHIQPDSFVVNCAAYTDVDGAEVDTENAYRVNAVAVEQMATICAAVDAPLLHFSTDYVFDGKGPLPSREYDELRPLGVYGKSKLAGEIAIRDRVQAHLILRTSWVFSATGRNFVTTLIQHSKKHSQIRVVNDQIGGPTAAHDIATAVLQIVAATSTENFAGWGTYHFSGAPAVSRYDFACNVLANKKDTSVHPIASAEYSMAARRPLNSVLDCSSIERIFRIAQPDWRLALAEVLRQLGSRERDVL